MSAACAAVLGMLAAAPLWAAAQAPAPAAPPSVSGEARPDPVRGAALVERAVEALGGAVAVDAVRALAMRGSGTRLVAGQTVEVRTVVHILFPGRWRQELTLPMGRIVSLLNRDGAYLVTDAGPLPLPESERQALEVNLGRNLVAILQARREARPLWTGTSQSAGVPLERVSVGSRESTTLGIDAASGLVREIAYASSRPEAPGEVRIVYSDYRAAGAIKYPFGAVGTLGGKPLVTSTLETVEVNGAMPDSLFLPGPQVRETPEAAPR